MSDPSLVQVTFRIKPNMPKDMKKLILVCFTNYYKIYYPNKKPSDDEIRELGKKYPEIWDLARNDSYHNVDLQQCQLDTYYLYDIDEESTFDIGVSIISLPRSPEYIKKFFQLVGKYITSSVSTLGICHNRDYGTDVDYYYMDELNRIRCHRIEISDDDEIIGERL